MAQVDQVQERRPRRADQLFGRSVCSCQEHRAQRLVARGDVLECRVPGGGIQHARQSPGAARGSEVDEEGNGTVSEQRLYQLIRQPQPIVDRLFEIAFLDGGVEAYAFTFG